MEYNSARALPAFPVPVVRPLPTPSHTRSAVLLALHGLELAKYLTIDCDLVMAASTDVALSTLRSRRPQLVVLDWDDGSIDRVAICGAASALSPASMVMAIAANSQQAPAAIRAGCHTILLKPFAPNLFAARIGRLLRESTAAAGVRTAADAVINRAWPEVTCTTCGTAGAVSFDFFSYRRAWYACLACDATWLGKLRE